MSNFRTKFDPHREVQIDQLDKSQVDKMNRERIVFIAKFEGYIREE